MSAILLKHSKPNAIVLRPTQPGVNNCSICVPNVVKQPVWASHDVLWQMCLLDDCWMNMTNYCWWWLMPYAFDLRHSNRMWVIVPVCCQTAITYSVRLAYGTKTACCVWVAGWLWLTNSFYLFIAEWLADSCFYELDNFGRVGLLMVAEWLMMIASCLLPQLFPAAGHISRSIIHKAWRNSIFFHGKTHSRRSINFSLLLLLLH